MKLKCLRARRKNIQVVVLALNVVCFGVISYTNIFSMQVHRWTVAENHTVRELIVPVISTTLDPIVMKKVASIHVDLNVSRLREEERIYPARKIGRYIMLDPDLCRRGGATLDVIVIVHTAPGNLQRRQRIRESFTDERLFLPFHVRVAFLLGRTRNSTLERVLWYEHVAHNDTVMGDFMDDYHNLTLKGVMGYRWVSQHCRNSKFVLKVDDDVMVNMFKLLYSFYNHISGKSKSIFCNLWHKDTMPILREGKWKVNPNVFHKMVSFPYDYCSGFMVLMTTDLAAPLYKAALATPFFWIDDVYLFGMLPMVAGGVTYYNYALDTNLTLNARLAINCTKTLGPRCPILASTASDEIFWDLWTLIRSIYASDSWQVEIKKVA